MKEGVLSYFRQEDAVVEDTNSSVTNHQGSDKDDDLVAKTC